MNFGDIVNLERLVFKDGEVDKKINRPCIFLFSEVINEKEHAYIMPITSQIKTFNKNSGKYVFIPEIIYRYKKLSFAKLDGIVCVPIERLTKRNISLAIETKKHLCKRITEYEQEKECDKEEQKFVLTRIDNVLTEILDKIASEKKKAKNSQKKLSGRQI